MDKGTTILVYILAGIGCALGWRLLLPRFVFRFKIRALGVVLTYVFMVGAFAATYAYLDHANAFALRDTSSPEVAGLIFFLSPVGLPLAIGIPVVLFFDLILAVVHKLGRYFTRNSGAKLHD
ncbi:hypothetical protein [Erythrobacter sp. YT30]|uniref:hypothetical protein n=1 Tax=Erythrobacter sp. YT30 TaxID=1735012 RepID=UPI00076DD264|nr:hypothetical protein [Erythrobacter sp. YT30]KWV93099.1 hypothetical protein AUC45_02960 [Erythrobacter sp. YT30]